MSIKDIRFKFTGEYDGGMTTRDRRGKKMCDICGGRFKSPDIEVYIHDFSICPSCIQAGPAAVAAEAERFAKDEDRIGRIWGYPPGSFGRQEDIAGMARQYRSLASALGCFSSFEDLPGGKTALGVAVFLLAPAGRRKGKAA